ncbi:hypothetical protein VNI00_017765 [Paramarasmius palmivorus]|uniref:Uncharacterized protein n=1 Tax=Paramarasmius palmivorus TaxID=297713 RepID=A0AAW0B4I7_9AGAR
MVSSPTHRRSPRKSHPSPRKLHAQQSKKQRGPRLCQRCGGKTLQKDCPLHSASARKQRQKTQLQKESTLNLQPQLEPTHSGDVPESVSHANLVAVPVLDNTGPDSQEPFTAPASTNQEDIHPGSQAPPSSQPASHNGPATTSTFVLDPLLENAIATPPRAATLDSASLSSVTSNNSSTAEFFRVGFPSTATTSPLAQVIESRGSSPFTPRHPRRLFTMDGHSISVPRGMTPAETLATPSSNSATPSSSAGSLPPQRIWASRSNAVYGFVHGVFKGSETWKIPRARPRKQPLVKGSVQKRFDEKLAGIVNRCEELCDETGAYLMITSQLPSARHGFVNYVSKSFRDEAPQSLDQLYDFTEDIYASVVAARRRDVASAEYQAAKARREAEEARTAAANAQADLDALSEKQQQQQQVLEGVRRALQEAGHANFLSMLDGLVPNTSFPTSNIP